jgi:hypothetical protein
VKRFGTIVLAVVAALTLLLLFADLHIAYTSDKTDSQQTMVRNTSNPAPQGNKLTVYLIGDLTLTNELKKQLPRAIQAKDLAFGEVLFLNKIPADSNENPLFTPDSGGVSTASTVVRCTGQADKNGLSIYVGDTNSILVPVGTCSLSGWQIKSS